MQARPSPPPIADPCTAATIGFTVRNSRIASLYRCRPGRSSPTSRRGELAAAQKGLPRAPRTPAPAARAGTEALALRRQHHGAPGRIGIRRFEGGGDLLDQGDVEEIVRRPLDLDD